MAGEKIFAITPVNGEKIKAVVNWIHKDERVHAECGNRVTDDPPWCETCQCHVDEKHVVVGRFGISFRDKYPYNSGGDVLLFAGKGITWSFR